jgi:FkbM family methyltransferase
MPSNHETDDLTRNLEQVLAQSASEMRQLEKSIFDKLAGTASNSLVLFGTGTLGRKTLRGLRKIGVEPLAFSDNNPSLHGRQVDGLIVLSPQDAAQKFGITALFLVTVYMDSAPGNPEPIKQKLMGLGCRNVASFLPLYWKHPDQFLPEYVYDLPHKVIEAADAIRMAWQLFNDQESRREYLAQLCWRLDPEFDQIPIPTTHEIYFPPDLITLHNREVFVDCGAYIGDTVRSFIQHTDGRFEKLFTFEPDPSNFKTLTEYIASLPAEMAQRIQPSNLALGSHSTLLHFEAHGAASSSISHTGELVVRSEPLDSILRSESPTYIKMDIEGAEIDALQGAVGKIREHLPMLAISAYHRQDHLWNIPLMIHSISTSYEFYLRRYTPWVLDDLVLYAIPKERMASNL